MSEFAGASASRPRRSRPDVVLVRGRGLPLRDGSHRVSSLLRRGSARDRPCAPLREPADRVVRLQFHARGFRPGFFAVPSVSSACTARQEAHLPAVSSLRRSSSEAGASFSGWLFLPFFEILAGDRSASVRCGSWFIRERFAEKQRHVALPVSWCVLGALPPAGEGRWQSGSSTPSELPRSPWLACIVRG